MITFSKIKVGPFRYTIKHSNEIPAERDGQCTPYLQQILVGLNLAPDYERDTVLHESLHAIIAHTILERMEPWDDKIEEAVVRSLAPGLLQLLRDNPKLVEYLTS